MGKKRGKEKIEKEKMGVNLFQAFKGGADAPCHQQKINTFNTATRVNEP